MNNFLIFYAPFLVLILSLITAFWIGTKDSIVKDHNED
ncbi:cytochrome bd oxidase small subunit CydS [Metabacillus fastidiosus]